MPSRKRVTFGAASFEVHSIDPVFQVGEMAQARLTAFVRGDIVDTEQLRASYHWLDTHGQAVVWDGIRTDHQWSDGCNTVSLKIVPPVVQGKYLLAVALVDERIGWSDPIVMPVDVRPGLNGPISQHAIALDNGRQNATERPLALVCETINVCNYRCSFCAYPLQQRPKGRMSSALFQRVLNDYSDLGGGDLSFTPLGEPLLDQQLGTRLLTAREHPAVDRISLTTNASIAGDLPAARLTSVVKNVDRLQLSIYGISRDEHQAITGRDDFDRMLAGVRAITTLAECELVFAIRTGQTMTPQRLSALIETWTAQKRNSRWQIPPPVNEYANWGVFDADHQLFDGATWRRPNAEKTQCLYPLAALKVSWNGRVSVCPCGDYDHADELDLGSLKELTLRDMCRSSRFRRFWNWQRFGVPQHCQQCTFYVGLENAHRIPNATHSAAAFFS